MRSDDAGDGRREAATLSVDTREALGHEKTDAGAVIAAIRRRAARALGVASSAPSTDDDASLFVLLVSLLPIPRTTKESVIGAVEMFPESLTTRGVPLLLVVLLLSPRLFLLVLLLAIAFTVGYIVAVPIPDRSKLVPPVSSRQLKVELTDDVQLASPISERGPHVYIPPDIDAALTKFLDLFVRDFINNWYAPINYSGSSEFPSAIHSSMKSGLTTLGSKTGRMSVTAAVVPISQTLQCHIREYRKLEDSSLPLPHYLSQHPESIFQRYYDSSAKSVATSDSSPSSAVTNSAHLRRLSAHIALTTLPGVDRASPVVFSFIRELVATSILASMVDKFSDPDYINLAIVDYCKGLMTKADAEAAAASGATTIGEGLAVPEDAPSVSSFPTKISRRATGDPEADQLYIKVVEGRRLPPGGANMFCGVTVAGETLKTRKVAGEACPSWSEDFQFEINKEDHSITVGIYESRLLRDDLVGNVNIPLASIHPNKFTKTWFPVDTSDSRLAKAAQALTAELLLELIIVSTCADGIESPTAIDRSMKLPTPRTPLGVAAPLTLDSVLNGSGTDDLLLEFMMYLESISASPNLQLYLMIASFQQGDGGSAEANSLFETFFGADARMRVAINSETIEAARSALAIDDAGNPGIFDDMKNEVLMLLDEHWKGFIRSDAFVNYARISGLTVSEDGKDLAPKIPDRPSSNRIEASDSIAAIEPPPPPKPPRSANAQSLPTPPRPEINVTSLPPPKPPRATISPNPAPNQLITPHLSPQTATTVLEPGSDDLVPAPTDNISGPEDGEITLSVPESSGEDTSIKQVVSAEGIEHISMAEREKLEQTDRLIALALQEDEESPPPLPSRPSLTQPNATNAMVAEIASLRERISVIDSSLESAPPGTGRARRLMDEKMELIQQVSVFMEMVAEAETDESGDPLSLSDICVRIVDLDDDLFAVEVERRDGTAGWMVTHPYDEFLSLHDALRERFPKVSKIAFPMLPPGANAFGWGRTALATSEGREKVGKELEAWINVVTSDGLVIESRVLQEFLMPENQRRQSAAKRAERKAFTSSSIVSKGDPQSGIGAGSLKQVFGAFKSAGLAVKKAAVSTGNVVTSVGGAAINSAAVGISNIGKSRPSQSEDPNKLSLERKLQERLSAPNRSPEVAPNVARSVSANSAPFSESSASSLSSSPERRAPSRGRSLIPGDSISGRTTESVTSSPTRSEISTDVTQEAPALPQRPKIVQQDPPPVPPRPTKIPPSEIETILECLFGTIEEVFHLSDPNQWIRQKGLHVVKSVMRRTHGSTIADSLQKWFLEARSTSAIVGYLNSTTDSMWPGGVWHADAPATAAPAIIRSDEDKADTRLEAKRLLLKCTGLLGLDGLERVLGRYNVVVGVTRIFNMLQHRELNQGLLCAILEALVLAALVDA